MVSDDVPTKSALLHPPILRSQTTDTTTLNQNRLLNVPAIKIIVIDGDNATDDSHTINSGNVERPDAITADKYHGADKDSVRHHTNSVDHFNMNDLLVAYRNYRPHRHRHIDINNVNHGGRHQSPHHHRQHHPHHRRRHLRGDYFNDYEDDICEEDLDNNDDHCSDEENNDHHLRFLCNNEQYQHRWNRFAIIINKMHIKCILILMNRCPSLVSKLDNLYENDIWGRKLAI